MHFVKRFWALALAIALLSPFLQRPLPAEATVPSHVATWCYYAVNADNDALSGTYMANNCTYAETSLGESHTYVAGFKSAGGQYVAMYVDTGKTPACQTPYLESLTPGLCTNSNNFGADFSSTSAAFLHESTGASRLYVITTPSTSFINTTSSTAVATGSHTITVASATNIHVGTVVAVDTSSNLEYPTVTSVSGTTIGMTFTKSHSGTYAVKGLISQEAVNPGNSTTQTGLGTFTTNAQSSYAGDGVTLNYFMFDDSGPLIDPGNTGAGCPGGSFWSMTNLGGVCPNEYSTESAWETDKIAMWSHSTLPGFYNGGSLANYAPIAAFDSAANIAGHMNEGCFNQPSYNPANDAFHISWNFLENSILKTISDGTASICLNEGPLTPAVRVFIYASFMMSYDSADTAKSIISWSGSAGGFADGVDAGAPEADIVPLNPLSSATGNDITTLRVGGTGLAVREFANCYQSGALIGPCAAIVNPTAGTLSLPTLAQTYTKSLTLSSDNKTKNGGGTATWTVGSPPSTLASKTAIILAGTPAGIPTIVQLNHYAATSSFSLPSPPTNGNVVSVNIVFKAGVSGVTVKDSNNVALTQQASSVNCISTTICAATYDYIVTGSPTGTYTASILPFVEQIEELSGVTYPGIYTGATSASTTSLTATQPGVLSGDIQLCTQGFTAETGIGYVTESNGTNLNSDFYTGQAVATSTASSTCSISGTSLTNVAMAYSDYFALSPPSVTAGNYTAFIAASGGGPVGNSAKRVTAIMVTSVGSVATQVTDGSGGAILCVIPSGTPVGLYVIGHGGIGPTSSNPYYTGGSGSPAVTLFWTTQ